MKKHPFYELTPDDCLALAFKLNPKKEPLKPEDIRCCPGFEQSTDEEVTEIIQSLEQLARIAIDLVAENSQNIDNQYSVSLKGPTEDNVIQAQFNQQQPLAA